MKKEILLIFSLLLLISSADAITDYTNLPYKIDPKHPNALCDKKCYGVAYGSEVQRLYEEMREWSYRRDMCHYEYGHEDNFVEGMEYWEYCGSQHLSEKMNEAEYARADAEQKVTENMTLDERLALSDKFFDCLEKEDECVRDYVENLGEDASCTYQYDSCCTYDFDCEWPDNSERIGCIGAESPYGIKEWICLAEDWDDPYPEICYDDKDNDQDGLMDCDDPDCFDSINCKKYENCNNGIDDDGDGLIDCREDPDCKGDIVCKMPESICDDNEDNDGDGFIDCQDEDCQIWDDKCKGKTEINCTDKKDNDDDGLIDCRDEDCLIHEYCNEKICDDKIDNEDDGFTDCEDGDCKEAENCKKNISLTVTPLEIVADGKSSVKIEVQGLDAKGEPVKGKVKVWIKTNEIQWINKLGFPEPKEGELSNGKFTSSYLPINVFELQQTMDPKELKPIKATIYARDEKSNETAEQEITILPLGAAKIEVIEFIQTLRGQPIVAGKKGVVMIGIKAQSPEFFKEKSEQVFLELKIKGEDFLPENSFKVNIAEESKNLDIVRKTEVKEHMDFFGLTGTEDQWLFYEFYVDPINAKHDLYYAFSANLHSEKKDGTEFFYDINGSYYDVFPSGFTTIKIVPIGIGLWKQDFCEFCTKDTLEEAFNEMIEVDVFPSDSTDDLELALKYIIAADVFISKRVYESIHGRDLSDFKFNCLKSEIMSAGFNFDGIVRQADIEYAMSENTVRDTICFEGFNKMFSGEEIQNLITQSQSSPLTGPDGKTGKQRYNDLVKESKEYFIDVMPLAEDMIYFQTIQEPFEPSYGILDGATNSPVMVLWALKATKSGRRVTDVPSGLGCFGKIGEIISSAPKTYTGDLLRRVLGLAVEPNRMEGFDRTAGFVPTTTSRASNVDFGDATGYMNNVINRYGLLVNVDAGEASVMTHELLHTYCAIDEYEKEGKLAFQIGMQTFIACAEGYFTINKNKGIDTNGTHVTNGFSVKERKFRGTPLNPNYSIMGEGTESLKWITNDLYYGYGAKIGTFPRDKEELN